MYFCDKLYHQWYYFAILYTEHILYYQNGTYSTTKYHYSVYIFSMLLDFFYGLLAVLLFMRVFTIKRSTQPFSVDTHENNKSIKMMGDTIDALDYLIFLIEHKPKHHPSAYPNPLYFTGPYSGITQESDSKALQASHLPTTVPKSRYLYRIVHKQIRKEHIRCLKKYSRSKEYFSFVDH